VSKKFEPITDYDGKSVMVTGGTGSFGHAFVKRVLADYKPRRLIVYSRDELKQFEMARKFDNPAMRFFLGDVRDEGRLRRAMRGVDVVIHAAALKQVPAAEYNPIECIKTNVLGAENIINTAIDAGVKKVVALSTDKAVNPTNLYGATKLCSDKLFTAGNNLSGEGGTVFSVVRYGNVIGSRGSVIPMFKEMAKNGTLPITDERMTRFWLSIDEGVMFVNGCLGMMRGGETFVPKIPSMKIIDLAKTICPDCKFEFIGIRPGEKLHEVMVPRDEARNTLEYSGFYIIKPSFQKWAKDDPMLYLGEKGKAVKDGFEYSSDTNTAWMSPEQLQEVLVE